MATSLLQQLFAGSTRDCIFDSKLAVTDVAVICHEVRGFDVLGGQVLFSVVNLGKGGAAPSSDKVQKTSVLGHACEIKGVSVDTTLLLQIWQQVAGITPASGNNPQQQGHRLCAELIIPLAWIVAKCGGLLYQTWASVDTLPRESASCLVRGFDLLSESESVLDGGGRFAKRLRAGESPDGVKACLSVCRAVDLGPGHRLVLSPDASHDERMGRWAALLTSQKQHEAISFGMHRYPDSKSLRSSSSTSGYPPRVDSGKQQVHEAESANAKAERSKKRQELDGLATELEDARHAANHKLDNGNSRIRSLKLNRDQAREAADRSGQQAQMLSQQTKELQEEVKRLSEDKEALMEIVEDLHRTCLGAGLESTGRKSVESIKASFKFE